MSEQGDLLFGLAGGIARLTLNRPERGNVLGPALLTGLHERLAACAQNPAVRVVLLSAAGPVFSLGGDLKHFTAEEDRETPAETLAMVTAFHNAVSLMVRMPKPVISVVNGMAAGRRAQPGGGGGPRAGGGLGPASRWPTPGSACRPTAARPTCCRG